MTDETTPANETPEKIYICPACGLRYDVPTSCANGHAPAACVEYDRATVAAADAGNADAIASVAATELAAVGVGAGTVFTEATPHGGLSVPSPVPAEVVPGTETAPVEPAAVEPAAVEPAAVEPAAVELPAEPKPENDVAPENDLFAQIEAALTSVIAHTRAALDELAQLKADAGV